MSKVQRAPGCYSINSWEQAIEESGGGYEDPISAHIHLADWEKHHQERAKLRDAGGGQVRLETWKFTLLVPLLHALGRRGSSLQGKLRVLDVGGSFGQYRDHLADICPQLELDWTVVETPSTVQQFADKERPDMRWREAHQVADQPLAYDLTFLCGTLPYMPQPYDALRKYLNNSRFCILGRLPMIERNEDQVFLQYVSSNERMPAFPGRFLSRPVLMQTAMEFAHVRSFYLDPPAMPLRTGDAIPQYYTILLESRLSED